MKINVNDKDDWRIMTSREHIASLGFHIYPQTSAGGTVRDAPIKNWLCVLSPSQRKALAGNGMHLAMQAAWCAYTLANLERLPG